MRMKNESDLQRPHLRMCKLGRWRLWPQRIHAQTARQLTSSVGAAGLGGVALERRFYLCRLPSPMA